MIDDASPVRLVRLELENQLAAGLRRGRGIFISQTDPESPSGHNLHDLGFRTLHRATWYTRPA